MIPVMNPVKQRIRRWLKRRERTQEWLAGELGITEGALSLILDGKRQPSLDIAVKIETITGVRPSAFVDVDAVTTDAGK